MDKQELIRALKEHIDLVTMPLTGNSYERGKMVGFETALSLVAKLEGYEVEEEPKWVVKVGNLYFCGWEDTTAQFVMNTMLGEEDSIIKYKMKGTALAVAKNLGGTVEKV